jgi:tRNA(Ile)-lysidine synthase
MRSSVKELSSVVKKFLEKEWDRKSPLMIAYSGGPDSKALLYAALDWGRASIHVAHVDHGWRIESGQEALDLEREIKSLGLNFHTSRLEETKTEEEARVARYAYFQRLREKIPYQALLLGHQAGDLAETVLKRIFEGAALTALTGMRPVSFFEGIELWRPLLSISRETIQEWLEEKKLPFLSDRTNEDPKFLRGRMRKELLPFLNQTFGKNISRNLLQISERSQELRDYFSVNHEKRLSEGPFGFWLDGTSLARVELRALIQQKITLPRSIVEQLIDWVEKKEKRKTLSAGNYRILSDNGFLFFFAK